jgi:hypothetical protein
MPAILDQAWLQGKIEKSEPKILFCWRDMQYYLIQEILVSDWIIGAARAQNGCF